MNKQIKNQSGFGLIAVILLVGILGIIGYTSWYLYHTNTLATKNAATNTVTTQQSIKLKQYCSDYGKVCFSYPENWTYKAKRSSDVNVPGLIFSNTNKDVEVVYEALVSGLGGYCEKGLCTYDVEAITTPLSNTSQDLRIIKGVFSDTRWANGKYYSVLYCITDASSVEYLGLKAGEKSDGLLYLFFKKPVDTGIESLCIQPKDNEQFATKKDADNWLRGYDVIVAGKILSSIELK